ncbi:hypothetical protein [Rhodoferax sp.]|uniref:hypothetical protein n=1 Tax=Rhodoferax sp. TaxID=50421 RepID=UPI00284E797C|nr:hypothetical protein [Rhodoferax sp.]MDR3369830.1 hypothetical protein [Rhodoferax sp.]
MTTSPSPEVPLSGHAPQVAEEIPIEQLVTEVYATAEPVVRQNMVARLVGKVYQAAPLAERGFLIRQLIQPLGILSLLAVANGVFAKLRLQGGLSGMQARLEDVQHIKVDDVIDLANFVQQVSIQAFDGLAQTLAASPVLASSAAAALLVKILMERARHRRETDPIS